MSSVVGLVNVIIFLSFIFVIFSIFGLQSFVGYSYYACRLGAEPEPGAKTWTKYEADDFDFNICTPKNNSIYGGNSYKICPEKTADGIPITCGTPLDYGLKLSDDGINANAAIQFGISSFDNIAQSFIGVF